MSHPSILEWQGGQKASFILLIYFWFLTGLVLYFRIHPTSRLSVLFQPPFHHGLQDRCPDLPGGGVGQGQGEAQAPERHVRKDDSC